MALSYVGRLLQPPMSSVAACVRKQSRDLADPAAGKPSKLLSLGLGGPGFGVLAASLCITSNSAGVARTIKCRASGGEDKSGSNEGVPAEASHLHSQSLEHPRAAGAITETGGATSNKVVDIWSRTTRCIHRLWRALLPSKDVDPGDFFRRASLDEILQQYEDQVPAPAGQGPPPVFQIFGREKLLSDFVDLLNMNVELGFNAERKEYYIVGITGGSGAGKTALLQHTQKRLEEWSTASEPAQNELGKHLKKGAFVVYYINFNGGGHRFSARDAYLSADERVGVRLFACLLGVSLESLRDEYGLPEEVERRLKVDAVVAVGARRQRLRARLDAGEAVLSIVFMDELNSGLVQVQQYVREAQLGLRASWPTYTPDTLQYKDAPSAPSDSSSEAPSAASPVFPPGRAPSSEPDGLSGASFPVSSNTPAPNESAPLVPGEPSPIEGYAEDLLRGMVERAAEAFTTEAGATGIKSKAGASGAVIGLLGIAGTGLPMLNLYPSSWSIAELTVTNLGQRLGAAIVEDRVKSGAAGRDEAILTAFQVVSGSREFRGLIQIYGGTPTFMVWLAQTFSSEEVKDQLLRMLTGHVSTTQVCSMIEAKVQRRLSAWSKYPITDERGMAMLGGRRGMLELVTLTLTGVPVGPRYLVGGRVKLSRAESTGVVFTKPFLRETPVEVARLDKEPRNKAAAIAEVNERLLMLPELTNPLRGSSSFVPTHTSDPTSLRVLDIPPAIQERMLDAVYEVEPELVEQLSYLTATSKAILNEAFVGPRLEESVQRLLVARFDMLGLAKQGNWVQLRDVFPGAVGSETLLSTEVLIEPLVPARDSRPLILGQKLRGGPEREGHVEARGEGAKAPGAGADQDAANEKSGPEIRKSGDGGVDHNVGLNPDALRLVDGVWQTGILVDGVERKVPLTSTGYAIRTDAPTGKCALVDLRFTFKARRGMNQCNMLAVVSVKKPTGGKGTAGKDVRILCENTSLVFQDLVGDGTLAVTRIYLSTGVLDHRALAWAAAQDDVLIVAGSGVEAFFPMLGVCPALRDRLQ